MYAGLDKAIEAGTGMIATAVEKFKEEKDLLVADESKGESIKRMKYDGCPHWQNKKKLDDLLS